MGWQEVVDIVPFLPDLAALIGAGIVAGFIAGLFGVGGGAITVPILFHWFLHIGVAEGSAMHAAVGTSLATIVATALSSARAHHRRGAIDRDILKSWGPWVACGSAAGAALAAVMSGETLRGFFGVVLLCVALYMFLTRDGTVMAASPPLGWIRRLLAGGIGAVSSLAGIGGGAMSVPAMSLCNVPLKRAVGTSSAFGVLIAVPGTIGFIISGLSLPRGVSLPPFSLGYVNLVGLMILLPVTTLMAPFGAKLAHRLDRARLRRIFSVFLMLVSIKMLGGLFDA